MDLPPTRDDLPDFDVSSGSPAAILSIFLLASAVLVLVLALIFVFSITHIFVNILSESGSTSGETTISVGVFDVIVSSLLTVAIIIVYWDIREAEEGQEKLMKQQKEILEEQQRLRRSTIQPDLRCEIVESKSKADTIYVRCFNDGPGRADNISFEAELFLGEDYYDVPMAYENYDFTPLSDIQKSSTKKVEQMGGQEVTSIEGFQVKVGSPRYVTDNGDRGGKRAAVDGKGKQDFVFRILINHYSGIAATPGEGRIKSFETMVDRFIEMGYGAIGYQLKISYENILGEQVEEYRFSSGVVGLEEGMQFYDVLSKSQGSLFTHELLGSVHHQAHFRPS